MNRIIADHSPNSITTFSNETTNALYRAGIREVTEKVEGFKKSWVLLEQIQRNPIKAKLLSVLASMGITSLIVGALIINLSFGFVLLDIQDLFVHL